jgi:FtsP/CotA-like multicopper oxidase with cupredoxin domain
VKAAVPLAEPLPSVSRRRALKAALALGSFSVARAARGDGGSLSSPPTTPFLEPMPVMPVVPQRPLTDPAFALPPTVAPNRATNPLTGLPYEGRSEPHQLRNINEPQYFFAQRFGAVPPASIHPNLQPQINFWGCNLGGADLSVDKPMTPMPTIVSRYQASTNTAILVRRFNDLPTGVPSGGFGKNQISIHMHNFHTAPDSDGGPCDPRLGARSEDPLAQGRFFFPGQYYDYYYNMKCAGFDSAGTPDGDVRETLGTLWYHDHREAHTAENVYKGLAGFHILFNDFDTGNENTGFRLPSFPQFDIPIIFTDLLIDPRTGQATFDIFETDGHLGDKYLVNGKVQPYFNVFKRRYRLRLLDMGPSRFYQLFLTNPDNLGQTIPYWRIANDGNLMPKPLQVTSVKMAVAERADIIVDFNKLTARGGPAPGATRLWLENRLVQQSGTGPDDKLHAPGNPANVLVEFRIGAVAPDASVDPAAITDFLPIALPTLDTPIVTRTFDFDRGNGQWMVNGRTLSCDEVRFTMKRGSTERWIYKGHGGWSHPIHPHAMEGRIIKRNGVPITASSQEFCRKDVVWLGNEEVEVLVKATDYRGVYPMHCHNVVHEDHAMMLLFAIEDVGDTNRTP